MAQIIAADTVPDPANPFGPQLPRGRRRAEFPEDRLRAVGLEDGEVARLREIFESEDTSEQNRTDWATSVRQIEDDVALYQARLILKAADYTTASKNIDTVLAEVEQMPQLAPIALRVEQARGDKARPTLIDQLEEIVNAQEKAVQEQVDKVTAQGLTPETLAESNEANAKAAQQTGDGGAEPAPTLAAVQEHGGKVVPAEQADGDQTDNTGADEK